MLKIISLTVLLFSATITLQAQEQQKIILDADTGNEVDDVYAIARAIIEPTWEITSLNAAHWQTAHWAVPQSMENSHRLNQTLLGFINSPIQTRRGGIARMFDWGDQAQHSAAAYEIIKQAKATPGNEKLTVITLGAMTNIASAIYIDPSIQSKIKVFALGTTYDFERNILKKNDFNCVMDIQAMEIMLMSDVELHIMPVSVASAMTFDYLETKSKLEGIHPMTDFILDRWTQHLDGGRNTRVIWDLALITAMIHPQWAEKVDITTSRDNGNRTIHYYKSIDADKIRTDFFEKVISYLKGN